jgi:peroxiredoxin Q/BCP
LTRRRLQPGDTAPAFTLPDQDGRPVSLRDFRGRRVVVYFYPADDTPGCTAEACGFNDHLAGFADTPVLGISPDLADSHRAFRDKFGLRFPLLTDAEHEVMDAYGAWGERTRDGRTTVGVIRSTFLVEEHGAVAKAWYAVKADLHAEEVLAALGDGRAGG